MTVLSSQSIRRLGILDPCEPRTSEHGLTHGLGPCGYDLRLDLGRANEGPGGEVRETFLEPGQFLLAAALEHFKMPRRVMGVVHDKSTHARRGLSVFNTVIEPGWRGFLTLELINHGRETILLPRGVAIAQVVFHLLDVVTDQPYPEDGKYQDQEAGPQAARA